MSSELEEREHAWKDKFEQFEIQAADQLNQLKQRQNDRRQAEEQLVLKKFDNILRPSRQLQDYRRQQQTLVKAQRYREAEAAKIKAEALAELERQKQQAEQQ